jgi:Uma2 family endonuclease
MPDPVDPAVYARMRAIARELWPLADRLAGFWGVEIGASGPFVLMSPVGRHESITYRVVRQLEEQIPRTHPGTDVIAQSGAEIEDPSIGRMRRPDAVVVPLHVLDDSEDTVDAGKILAVVEVVSKNRAEGDGVAEGVLADLGVPGATGAGQDVLIGEDDPLATRRPTPVARRSLSPPRAASSPPTASARYYPAMGIPLYLLVDPEPGSARAAPARSRARRPHRLLTGSLRGPQVSRGGGGGPSGPRGVRPRGPRRCGRASRTRGGRRPRRSARSPPWSPPLPTPPRRPGTPRPSP